jgi:hypothetical protein
MPSSSTLLVSVSMFIPFPIALVRRQPSHDLGHLRIRVDPEALVLGYARQLYVLAIQFLFHDLFQRLERKHLGFGQGKRLVELVL